MNIYTSLRRVIFGFAIATVVGIPLGVLCGLLFLDEGVSCALDDFRAKYPHRRLDSADAFFFRHRMNFRR